MNHYMTTSVMGVIKKETFVKGLKGTENYINLFVVVYDKYSSRVINIRLYDDALNWYRNCFTNVGRSSVNYCIHLIDAYYKPENNCVFCKTCCKLFILKPNAVEIAEND